MNGQARAESKNHAQEPKEILGKTTLHRSTEMHKLQLTKPGTGIHNPANAICFDFSVTELKYLEHLKEFFQRQRAPLYLPHSSQHRLSSHSSSRGIMLEVQSTNSTMKKSSKLRRLIVQMIYLFASQETFKVIFDHRILVYISTYRMKITLTQNMSARNSPVTSHQ